MADVQEHGPLQTAVLEPLRCGSHRSFAMPLRTRQASSRDNTDTFKRVVTPLDVLRIRRLMTDGHPCEIACSISYDAELPPIPNSVQPD